MSARNRTLSAMSWIILVFLLPGCLHGPASNTGGINNLAVTMWASSACVQPGDTVQLRATVENHGSQTEVIDAKDRPVLDILIGSPGNPGSYLVHWSDGKPLTPDLTRLELKGGESKTIEMDWVAPSNIQPYGVDSIFLYRDRPGFDVRTGVTVNVGECPSFLGP